MKNLVLHIILCFAFVLQGIAQETADNEFLSNQLYVKVIPPVKNADAVQYIPYPDDPDFGKSAWSIIKSYGGQSMVKAFNTNYKSLQNVYKVTLKKGADIDALISELNSNGNVEYAEKIPIYTITAKPLDLDEGKQWYFKTINMDASWSFSENPSGKKVIAVIDNGVNYRHRDLANNIAVNLAEIPNDGIDNDNNGYVDDFIGWDVVDNNGDPSALDIDPILRGKPKYEKYGWHGTHVSGIIAAGSNNGGIASIGINNLVLPIKAAGVVDGELSDHKLHNVNEAFRYAIDRKVDVINCSFGSEFKSIVTQEIINEARSKGIIIVAAAGNFLKNKLFYPAAYDNVIAVGATTREDKVWEYSNWGSYVDVMAPGHEIYSTSSTDDNSFGYLSGTSMAAPIVSGMVGLILSNAADKVDEVEAIIKNGCDNIDANNPDFIGKMGSGRVNVDKSFEYLLGMTSVKEVREYTGFSVYPNPANSQIFIPFNEVSATGQGVKVKILNSVGTAVAQHRINNQSQAISVAGLSQGIYQIIVTNSSGENYHSRLLVNR